MRALLCHCRKHLEAPDDRALAEAVRKHLMLEHPTLVPTQEQAWQASVFWGRAEERFMHRIGSEVLSRFVAQRHSTGGKGAT